MRSYDLVVVLRPSLNDVEKKKQIAAIKKLLGDMKITLDDEWGQKPLAYIIKKELAGYYYLFKFETENTVPAGFEQKILTNENILRHLLLRTK